MRTLAPLLGLILLASGCRTAPSARSASASAAASRTTTAARRKAYYLLKGPATVGWVSDRPFRYVSYDDKAQRELAPVSKAASFAEFFRRAKTKGYRLVLTKHGP